MKISILTIFPDQIVDYLKYGVTRIAKENSKIEYDVQDLRKYTLDKHKKVDDRPFGGGAGMVMKVDPVFKALEEIKQENSKVIILTPVGKTFNQEMAKDFADDDSAHYILICGHYEGFDYRIHQHLADLELSIGNYVLSGGELGALIFTDAVTRLVPGVLGNEDSLKEESFENDSLEYPQYTRPEDYKGWKVPDVLLSGNHAKIEAWRKENSKSIK
jgi:tRNA (guanine37-N1)-methyltransferase